MATGDEYVSDPTALPYLLTVAEVATLLRLSVNAVYVRASRGLLPGAVKDGKRLLFLRDVVLSWITQRRAASPGATRR